MKQFIGRIAALLASLSAIIPSTLAADLAAPPPEVLWYVHVDVARLRTAKTGQAFLRRHVEPQFEGIQKFVQHELDARIELWQIRSITLLGDSFRESAMSAPVVLMQTSIPWPGFFDQLLSFPKSLVYGGLLTRVETNSATVYRYQKELAVSELRPGWFLFSKSEAALLRSRRFLLRNGAGTAGAWPVAGLTDQIVVAEVPRGLDGAVLNQEVEPLRRCRQIRLTAAENGGVLGLRLDLTTPDAGEAALLEEVCRGMVALGRLQTDKAGDFYRASLATEMTRSSERVEVWMKLDAGEVARRLAEPAAKPGSKATAKK